MNKKTVLIVSLLVFLAAAASLMLWRSHIMGPDARVTAGGLVPVSASGTPIPSPLALSGSGPVTENPATQDAGDLRISLSLNPYPPTVSKSSEFTVTLTKVSGQAISDAAIRLDLTMPGMYMPPNQLTLLSAGNGTYTATGPFTMRGPWRIEVLITISGKTQSVFFDVWL
jgi:hypothetical protein